jgi:hypothetical protein
VIARLAAAVVDALADPMVRSPLAECGAEPFPREQQTPEDLLHGTEPKSKMVADPQGLEQQAGLSRAHAP